MSESQAMDKSPESIKSQDGKSEKHTSNTTRNITTARKVTAEIIIVIGMVVGIGMDIHIIIQADIIMEIIHIDREIVIEMIQDGAKRDLELNHPLLQRLAQQMMVING
ncbi:MAG: hypothetical protein EZS28_039807 [Streblomastix strix]|uniref:Uncharacterized protein n=1 Tax=Streblomastix strix TaxID=222440 RepID=A0A5J4U295_9EUKA|nr:MAG: hypothetical protein EZS28_039807 [Streblomastix strix]